MARVKSIAIGPGVGSAGDATYRSVRGRTIMSARIRSNSSNTPLQASQRSLFGLSQRAFRVARVWPEVFFERTKYGSKVNAITKANIKNIETVIEGDDSIDEYDVVNSMLNADSETHVVAAKGSLPYFGTEVAGADILPNITGCNIISLDPSAIEGVGNPTLVFAAIFKPDTNSYATENLPLMIDVRSASAIAELTSADLLASAAAGVLPAFVGEDTLLKVLFPIAVTGSNDWNAVVGPYKAAAGLSAVTADNYSAVGWNGGTFGFHSLVLNGKVASLSR